MNRKTGICMVNRLIILSVNFKIALRMRAYRTDLRSLGSDNNMAAVPAFPDLDFALLKYFLERVYAGEEEDSNR